MVFDINERSGLLLIGFVQGLVYAGMLFYRSYRENRLSDRLLATILLVCCVYISHYLFGFAGWFQAGNWQSRFMFYFPIENLLLLGPLIYHYFRALTNSSFRITGRQWLHYIPGGFILLLYAAFFLHDFVYHAWINGGEFQCFNGAKGPLSCAIEGPMEIPLHFLWTISMMAYTAITLRDYRRYRRYLNDNYADQENISFGWLRNLLIAFVLGLAVSWTMDIIELLGDNIYDHAEYYYAHLVISIMIYVVAIIAYNGTYRLPELHFAPVEEVLEEDVQEVEEKENGEGDMPEELGEWKGKLERIMVEERPYLKAGLTLKELSAALQTNPSVLSKVINAGFGQNFNDFINARRVEAVKEMIQSPDTAHLTLLGIANECGFNSKSTFNRAFKKFAGMSPREFLMEKSS